MTNGMGKNGTDKTTFGQLKMRPKFLYTRINALIADAKRDIWLTKAGKVPECATDTGTKMFYGLPINNSFTRKESGWYFKGNKITDKKVLTRLEKMRIPPAWKNVHIAEDIKNPLQAIGLDAKGRIQRRYSAAHIEKAAKQKFIRVKEFSHNIGRTRQAILHDMDKGDPRAFLLHFEDKTAIRIGTNRDLKAVKKAYGITTLQNRHVIIIGEQIKLNFIGKEGIRYKRTFKDSRLAEWLKERKTKVGLKEALFPDVTAHKLNGYLKSIAGKDFSVKDFRTFHATEIAYNRLKRYENAVLSVKKKKDIVKSILKNTSNFLGNTPIMAKTSYIDPSVWQLIGGL